MSLFTDLVNVINLVHPLSGFGGLQFNPSALIKAVNYCHSLGYDKSLQLLQLYAHLLERIEDQLLERTDDQLPNIPYPPAEMIEEPKKIFMVARLLFTRKDKQIVLPDLRIGMPMFINPKDKSLAPWFPLHLAQDLPLLLPTVYIVLGCPQEPNTYLDWCAKECELRSAPLLPNNNPLDTVDEFLSSETCISLLREDPEKGAFWQTHFCKMLRLQALRAVSNIFPLSPDDERKFIFSEKEMNEIWQKYRQAVATNISWNPVTNEFVLKRDRALG